MKSGKIGRMIEYLCVRCISVVRMIALIDPGGRLGVSSPQKGRII